MPESTSEKVRSGAKTARAKVTEATEAGRDGATKVKETVMPMVDSVVDALGGVSL